MKLDKRLQEIASILNELRALRSYLLSLGDEHKWVPIKWINSDLEIIEPLLNDRFWPPIWWRFMAINAALSGTIRNFHRLDGDGSFHFVESSRPGFIEDNFPIRDKIMAWVDKIKEMQLKTT
ncbi:hypothetical protein [Undibacterium sp. Tian12W]|uniref:hypothetical protein n=1 Tax=Undibacterium sp. Tian12W TaxID=3413054 RepID=UPI003BF38497